MKQKIIIPFGLEPTCRWIETQQSLFTVFTANDINMLKVAYYSFPETKIKILKSVKFKQQDVSFEVLVTAFYVKCNFYLKCKSGKNAKYNDRASERGLETRHFKGFLFK